MPTICQTLAAASAARSVANKQQRRWRRQFARLHLVNERALRLSTSAARAAATHNHRCNAAATTRRRRQLASAAFASSCLLHAAALNRRRCALAERSSGHRASKLVVNLHVKRRLAHHVVAAVCTLRPSTRRARRPIDERNKWRRRRQRLRRQQLRLYDEQRRHTKNHSEIAASTNKINRRNASSCWPRAQRLGQNALELRFVVSQHARI